MVEKDINGVLATIGVLPIVALESLLPGFRGRVFAKIGTGCEGLPDEGRAVGVLLAKIFRGELDLRRTVVVDCSSGIVPIALAQICGYFGLRFIYVADTTTPDRHIDILRERGAVIEVLTDPGWPDEDSPPARWRRSRQLAAAIPHAIWPLQYCRRARPAPGDALRDTVAAVGGRVDYVFGTTDPPGMLRQWTEPDVRRRLGTTVVPVAAAFSVPGMRAGEVSDGETSAGPVGAGPVGAPRADRLVRATALDCVVGCRYLVAREEILAGALSGAAVFALRKLRRQIPDGARCLLFLPDSADGYLDSVYCDEWVARHFGAVSHLWETAPDQLSAGQ